MNIWQAIGYTGGLLLIWVAFMGVAIGMNERARRADRGAALPASAGALMLLSTALAGAALALIWTQ